MSENNHAALALFAECDSLLQNLSLTDESALSGGGALYNLIMIESLLNKEATTYKESCCRRRKKNRREKRREKMC